MGCGQQPLHVFTQRYNLLGRLQDSLIDVDEQHMQWLGAIKGSRLASVHERVPVNADKYAFPFEVSLCGFHTRRGSLANELPLLDGSSGCGFLLLFFLNILGASEFIST